MGESGRLVKNAVVVLAGNARIGGTYLSRTGREIVVKAKEKDRIVVQAVFTGNNIDLPPNYPLHRTSQAQM